jgi:hypothetical protein
LAARDRQFGEGIFIHFDEEAIAEWLGKEASRLRHDKLVNGYVLEPSVHG